MIGAGFPLLGPQASTRRPYGGLRPAPMPFQPPVDFPMRGGGVPQLAGPGGSSAGSKLSSNPVPGGDNKFGRGVLAGPGGVPGGRGGLGARMPVLNPFERQQRRTKAGSTMLGPVLGVAR